MQSESSGILQDMYQPISGLFLITTRRRGLLLTINFGFGIIRIAPNSLKKFMASTLFGKACLGTLRNNSTFGCILKFYFASGFRFLLLRGFLATLMLQNESRLRLFCTTICFCFGWQSGSYSSPACIG